MRKGPSTKIVKRTYISKETCQETHKGTHYLHQRHKKRHTEETNKRELQKRHTKDTNISKEMCQTTQQRKYHL